MGTRLSEISAFLQQGRVVKVKDCVQQALDAGIPTEEILEKGLMDGMNTVGQDFKRNKVFVPEVLIAACTMTKGVSFGRIWLQRELRKRERLSSVP